MTKKEATALAAKLIANRPSEKSGAILSEIPEKVVIKKLSDQYEPVEFPHRKIITKLLENIKDDKIAGHFHTDPGTLCQGCHHNSPPSKTPPQCGSCHGKPFDAGSPFRAGLMGAYHEQCFRCHAEMGIEKPASRDCTACHLKKRY
jgi:predicted CXXCH cytochrome family protein